MNAIVDYLLDTYRVERITDIPTENKVDFLCSLLDINAHGLDTIISSNPQVLRTVNGHSFEAYFDELLVLNGYSSEEMGGDTSIDRKVNNYTLQLKTPYKAGTTDTVVQYKCHKTHGAKSELESMNYYHSLSSFADFFVGLISYTPQKILILHKSQLPLTHNIDNIDRIKSPFAIDLENTDGINAFQKLGLNIDPNSTMELAPGEDEILPLTSKACGVNSEVIINTIINKSNFRIWDMSIKGFAREYVFTNYAKKINMTLENPAVTGRDRYDKADFVTKTDNKYKFYQMKGLSINHCKLDIEDPIIATETQLTRGRVNDHPTQSRLYLVKDFDYLLLAIEPSIANMCKKLPLTSDSTWEFYSIPVSGLEPHHKYNNRLKSVQRFRYSDLARYKI